MRWMILGGGGCFGVHLAKHLLSQGQSVVSVGRSPLVPPWSLGMSDNLATWDYQKVHIGNEFEKLGLLMCDFQPEVIVNFAALAYATSWENSQAYYDTNVRAVARITEWLTGKTWLKRFVQIGSSEVYGSTSYPADEHATLRPSSPYAVSKLAADLHVLSLPNFPGVIVRPCNCYGEGQLLYRLIPRAIWSALNGKKIPLQGGGTSKKTWMHAEDFAKAIVTIVEYGGSPIYNAGTPVPVTNHEIMQIVSEVTGIAIVDFVEEAPSRAWEDTSYRLSSAKLYALGPWSPKISLKDGITRVHDWMRKNLGQIGDPMPFVLRP